MTKKMTFLIALLCCLTGYAQFGPQQVISVEGLGSRGVFAADFDGDGDMDVVSVSSGNQIVAWFENLDGDGTFGPQQIISTNLTDLRAVFASDLDGDGDADVLVTSSSTNKIVWYENLDGLGDFDTEQIITILAEGPLSIHVADLDGDADMDVLSASFLDNEIAWYENVDGLGNFGGQQIITSSALSARDVYAADLDGDGDIDVIATSTSTDEVVWFENTDGLGSFGPANVVWNDVNGANSVFSIDIDGDNDADVLSASPADNKLSWHENIDGLGTFGNEHIITVTLDNAQVVYAADLDNDGDIDVLSGSQFINNGTIVWFENTDGQGTFGPEQIISTEARGPRDVFAADLDNDGDMDVLSASIVDHKIAWYENLTILSIDDNGIHGFSIYPNPTNQILNIEIEAASQIDVIRLYDSLGRLVIVKHDSQNQIDVSSLQNGLFFLSVETQYGIFTAKLIKH